MVTSGGSVGGQELGDVGLQHRLGHPEACCPGRAPPWPGRSSSRSPGCRSPRAHGTTPVPDAGGRQRPGRRRCRRWALPHSRSRILSRVGLGATDRDRLSGGSGRSSGRRGWRSDAGYGSERFTLSNSLSSRRVMAISTYPTGDPVPRGHRPHHRYVQPGVAGAARGRLRVRRTSCSSSSTTWASASCRRSVVWWTPRSWTTWPRGPAVHEHAHHGAVLAVAGVRADRAQPSLPGIWRASPRRPPATRVTTACCPSTGGCCPEMLLPLGYNTFCVGKWHLTPAEHTTAAGPFDRWPLGVGSSGTTGSWVGRPTSGTPS